MATRQFFKFDLKDTETGKSSPKKTSIVGGRPLNAEQAAVHLKKQMYSKDDNLVVENVRKLEVDTEEAIKDAPQKVKNVFDVLHQVEVAAAARAQAAKEN